METVEHTFADECVWCSAFVTVPAGNTILDRSGGRVLIVIDRLAHLLPSSAPEMPKEEAASARTEIQIYGG
jgi:hypothetical protein